MVFQQYRRVDVGDVSIEELDMSISITYGNSSGLEFDISVWNLTDKTWRSINEGDPCRVVLGWEDGPTKNVLFGTVDKLTKETDGSDMKFRFKGKDETDTTLRYAFSESYDGKAYTDIAKSIAGEIGLTVGDVESSSAKPARIWTISKDRSARYWLNQILSKVQEETGQQWEWFVDSGKFYFVKKDGRKEQAVELSFDNTLITIGEDQGEKEAEQSGLKFEAMCEPRIRKGAAIVVSTDDYSGAYKVTQYRYESDTTTGEHTVSGKLAPLGANYKTTVAGSRGLIGGPGRTGI